MLVAMIQDFPGQQSLMRYLAPQLASLNGINPEVIVEQLGPVARRFPSDPLIMGIACNAHLLIGEPAQAIELANIWRSNIVGTPMPADLLIAQGHVQLERYGQASRMLTPYLEYVDQN